MRISDWSSDVCSSDLPITDTVWLDMLRREVGEEAVAMHRAMLSGGLIVPESNDFGPCFRRTTKMIRRFDVGFDFSSLIGADKVVRDLKPGSDRKSTSLNSSH